jgi:hypothetical protein
MTRLASCVLLALMLATALACSSSSSLSVKKDIYGNVTGQWQMVVDDNGYVTYIWVSAKPGEMIEISAPGIITAEGWAASKSTDSVILLVSGEPVEFSVLPLTDSVVLTAPQLPILEVPLAPAAE